uniref:sarcospan isoform X2 n=1 Tax=Vespula vulgaris TaxID=7454 RepID=UPI00223BE2D4|nr:sarcospan isoform X2 [Vespula vulgaris]
MSEELRTQRLGTLSHGEYTMQAEEEIQYAPRSRPVSFYDNFKDVPVMPTCVTSAMSVGNLSQVRENDTTSSNIPQSSNNNNNNNNRVSSAMSAGNVSKIQIVRVTGAQKFLPPLVYHRQLARCLAALQTILGIAITSLSLWLLLWAPNLPITDNPYWSGMPLLLSGSFGVCLLCCFKKEYPGMSPGFCLTLTKAISTLLAISASVACVLACISATMHLAHLMRLECTPARVLNATCVCRPREQANVTVSEASVKYMDLNCPEVESILTILLIFSSTCNAFGAIVAGWYSYLHWSTRRKRPKYVPVRTTTFDSSR